MGRAYPALENHAHLERELSMSRLRKVDAEAPVAPSEGMDLFSRGGCPGARGVAGDACCLPEASTPRAVVSPHGAGASDPAAPHVPDTPGAGEEVGFDRVCSADDASARRSTTPPPLDRGEPAAGGILSSAPAPGRIIRLG